MIKALVDINISGLKEAIKKKCNKGVLRNIDAKDLVLWKVSTSL